MRIIDRIVWFISNGVNVVIVAVIALMIVRLITDAMDLNPFGWTSRTVRRLSDGFVMPVRGGLRGFGIDPKFAPIVVMLLAFLLGMFVYQLAWTVGSTLSGIIASVQSGSVFRVIGFIVSGLISIYILLIVMRVIFSWGMLSYRNRLMRFLVDVTEPLLGPLRRMIPRLGWLDISPIVAILILMLFQQAVAVTLLSGPFRSF